jgi:hypothetical protein
MRTTPLQRLLPALLVLAALLFTAQTASSAPTITRLNLRGLQSGATTTLTIDGADLLPSPKLICSAAISSQSLKPGATAAKIQLDVTIDAKTDPGFYNLWLVTEKGVSQLQIIAIDSLPQQVLGKQVADLPVALHGNFTGSREIETTFTGKSGQHVTIEAEAQRLGGKEQPVIHLLDSTGHELSTALPSSQLRGDSRLSVTLPSDGAYTVRLHDLQYAGNGAFRLKIGSWQYADIAFPPAVQRGKTTKLALIGADGAEQHVVCTPGDLALMPAPWPDAAHASGMRPVVLVSDVPELVEERMSESPMSLSAINPPFAVSGRLSRPGEQGRYKLDVTPETPVRLNVIAAQIGSPIDAVLEVRGSKGELLASNDDMPGTLDPQLDFKAAKGVTSVVVVVRDANGRGSEGSIYRLVVTPGEDKPGAAPVKPDFDLLVQENALTPSPANIHLMKVIARRRGYDGPIALHLEGAADNVKLQRAEIPAGADAALIVVTAKPVSAESSPAIVHLIGQGGSDKDAITRVAAFDQHPLGELQPWLGNDLLVSQINEEINFSAEFGDAADAKGVLAQKVKLPIRCVRPPGFDGPVRLTLLTSQVTPLLRNAPDPTRTLRTEVAAVQIPADAKLQAANDAKTAAEKAAADAEKAVSTAKAAFPALETKVTQAADVLEKAKAAVDPKVAAEKALADAQTAAKEAKMPSAALEAKVKQAADRLAKLKAAPDPKAPAAKALADAENALKTAKAALPALETKLTQAAAALEKATTAAGKAAESAKNSMDVTLLVPGDLAVRTYDLAFKAELLGRDQKVLATAFTPVKTMNAISPIRVVLDSSPQVEVRLNARTGAVARWSGKIERLEGVKGAVTIAFEGLPKSLTDPKVVIPADKSEFKVEFKIPVTAETGAALEFKLFATIKPDAKAVTIVKSPNIDLALTVLPVKKPAKIRSGIRL